MTSFGIRSSARFLLHRLSRIVFCALLLSVPSLVFAQSVVLKDYDYADVGLSLSVPASWTHNGLMAMTKAEFIRQFGWNYQKPDSSDLWSAFGSFIETRADSNLVPADEAYSIHRLTLSVHRARTWYKQGLCRFGRKSLFEEIDLVKPDARLLYSENLDPPDTIDSLLGNYAKAYERTTSASRLPTLGRVYTFLRGEMCYTLRMESTSNKKSDSRRIHEMIINNLRLLD